MSYLWWTMKPDEYALVAVDTLSSSIDLKPHIFVDKATYIAHMGMIVAGTGSLNVLNKWIETLRSRVLAKDIDMLDLHAQAALRRLAAEVEQEFGSFGSLTAYHFGWSAETDSFVRRTYRSENDFDSELSNTDETAYKPAVPLVEVDAADPIAVGEALKRHDDVLPTEERVGIGGDIMLLALQPGAKFSSSRIHRFEDYEATWLSMNHNVD